MNLILYILVYKPTNQIIKHPQIFWGLINLRKFFQEVSKKSNFKAQKLLSLKNLVNIYLFLYQNV